MSLEFKPSRRRKPVKRLLTPLPHAEIIASTEGAILIPIAHYRELVAFYLNHLSDNR